MSAPVSTAGIFDGTHSDAALANRVLTTDEIASWAFDPPPTSTRDLGWYRAAHKVRIQAKSDVTSAWHVPIALATGALNPRVELPRYGSRFALRLSGVGTGRPASCNALAFSYAREGGVTEASDGGYYQFPEFVGGVAPALGKPTVPKSVAYDLMNVDLHAGVLKSRRGFRILTGVGSSVSGTPCAFYDATNASGQTYHLFFAGGSIYAYDNGNLTSVDTGWPVNELPTCATVANKTFFLSSSRKRVFIDGTFYDAGVAAPTTTPNLVSINASEGGVVATAAGVEYVYTFYNGTKLTNSGPSPILRVVMPVNSAPSTIRVGISVSSDSAVTERWLWRRKVGDANNVFQYVGAVTDNTTTYIDDTSELPGIETLEEFGGLAVTASFPTVTACAESGGKLFAWNPGEPTLYVSELGDGERWWAGSTLTVGGGMRGVIGASEGRALIFTDKTVESIEGDFLRSPTGEIGITRHVLDPSKGSFGPFAQTVAAGRVFWADASGVHTMQVGAVNRDVSVGISWPVTPIVQSAVDTLGTNVVLEYDYVSGQLWCCLSRADTTNSTKNRVVLVLDLEKKRWTVFDHPLSHIARVRDGTYGYFYVGCDYYGNVLELDVYDGDGIQGNESWFTGIVATGVFSSCSVTNKTITFTGAGLPTTGNGLRGVSIITEDVSAGTFARYTILSNTADTVTLDAIPSALVVGDKAYIGAIYWFIETGEVDAGTLDKKVLREVAVGLVDAANGAL